MRNIIRALENSLEWIITGLVKAASHEIIVTDGKVVKSLEIFTIRDCTITYIYCPPQEVFPPIKT